MRTLEMLLFRLKWRLMSPRARYAYLWNRTRPYVEAELLRTLRRG